MRWFWIDRFTKFVSGQSAAAIKNVSLSEEVLDTYAPPKTYFPTSLIIEGMAQLSGLLLEEGVRRESGRNVKALMSIVREAKFRVPVYPGDQLTYEATVDSVNELGGTVRARALVSNGMVASCSLVFSFHEIDNPRLEARRDAVLSLWLSDPRADEGA